jgi:hypothetical protein
MRDGTKEEIMAYFKVTKAGACHLQHKMKKGYKWL